jgi:hypothetical protein
LLIGAADCNEQGSQLWDAARQHRNENKHCSWTSIVSPTDYSRWMSFFRFKQYKQFIHRSWEDYDFKVTDDPWWRIKGAIDQFNHSRQYLVQTSEICTIDESIILCAQETGTIGD